MLSWEDIVRRYITKYSNRIRKTTQPLRDYFNIGYFTYHHIDKEGKYTVLVDRPDWAEHYVSEKIYLNDPYLRQPKVYESGICLVENHGSEGYKEIVFSAGKKVLDMDMGVFLIQKQEDSVEFFGFTGKRGACSLEKIYMNHPHLLKSFAKHFKKELGPILRQMYQDTSSLIDLKGSDFFVSEPICKDIDLKSKQGFLEQLGMKSELEKFKKMSVRERQCLQLLLEGRSSKETGAILGLSARTVEFYFENIKNKLSCWSKLEVLETAKNFRLLGLI